MPDQPATGAGAFQDDEHRVSRCPGGTLAVEVSGQGGEEPARDRDDPLMAALALGDEEPPVGELNVTQPQAGHLAAAQAAKQQRRTPSGQTRTPARY